MPGFVARLQRRGDSAQSTVETALVLPVVVIALVLVLQVGMLISRQVLVTHGAREGARVLAVEADAGRAAEAVRSATGLDADRLEIDVEGSLDSGSLASVEVRYRYPVFVPMLSVAVNDVDLTARVTARIE